MKRLRLGGFVVATAAVMLAPVVFSLRGGGLDEPAGLGDAPTIYVCPMHPEVTSDKPGRCPKCHMKLEPRPAPPSP